MNLIERTRHSIGFRLWALLAAMIMFVLALAAVLLGSYGWRMQQRQFEENIVMLAQLMSLNNVASLAFDDVETAQQDVTMALELRSVLYVAVLRPDGSVFAEAGMRSPHPCTSSFPRQDDIRICRKPSCICVVTPVRLRNELVGYISIEQDTSRLNQLVNGMLTGAGGVFASTLLLALVLADRIGRTITRPVTRLALNVRNMAEDQRIDTREFTLARDEIGDLARGVNDMFDKVVRSRAELERSLTLLRTLFDTIPMPVYSKDHQLVFTAMNHRFAAEVAGKAPEAITGQTLEQAPGNMDADTVTDMRRREEEILASGESEPFEITTRDAAGNPKTYRVLLGLLRNGSDKKNGLIGVMQDITEIRRIGKELIDVSMREQQRLARDLHDNLGQLLTAAAVRLKMIGDGMPTEQAPAKEAMSAIIDMINRTSREARAMSHGLNPVDVERGGLLTALQKLASSTEIFAGKPCRFHTEGELPELDKDQSNQLYRIAQEAANNAVRHAGATTIEIHLARVGDDVVLTIADDGRGIEENPGQDSGGMGLRIMKQRALIIHGDLSCRPRNGGGTEVVCRCPPGRGDDPS